MFEHLDGVGSQARLLNEIWAGDDDVYWGKPLTVMEDLYDVVLQRSNVCRPLTSLGLVKEREMWLVQLYHRMSRRLACFNQTINASKGFVSRLGEHENSDSHRFEIPRLYLGRTPWKGIIFS
jgi:hypothetical protein